MLVTTTNTLEGHPIETYFGLVHGEVVAGINMIKDIGAGIRNIFGGRSAGYEDELVQAREQAVAEMIERASRMGANAVVGFRFEYQALGADGSMLLVSATGTAVRARL